MQSLNELFEKKENRSLEIIAQEILDGLYHGKHKSPFHGFSSEFKEYTHFQMGENPRQIDWKLFGKTDKLYKKRHQDERNIQVVFVLDTSSSMYFPSENSLKMEKAIQWIAIMCNILHQQHDAFGLVLLQKNTSIETPISNSKSHLQRIIEQLEKLRNRPKEIDDTNFSMAFSTVMESLGTRKMIFLLSDLLFPKKEYVEFLTTCRSLAFRKNQLTLLQVFHPSEEEITSIKEGETILLSDLETKEIVQIAGIVLNQSLKQLKKQIDEEIIYPLLTKGIKSKKFNSEKPIGLLIKESI
jgi:uncharacterized protein (DUF58 family)